MKVVEFKKKTEEVPHTTGDAFCIQCKHEWIAVVPEKQVQLQCPKCLTFKGLFKYPACVPEGEEIRRCECGNDLFYLTPNGHLCPNCSDYQNY